MGRLIKLEQDSDEFSIRFFNILLLGVSALGILNGLADWQHGHQRMAKVMMSSALASAGLVDFINQRTKSHFALKRLQSEAETRQQARSVQAQEDALSADLSVARNQRLTQLNIENAEINAALAARMLELEHQHANLVAQLQEFMEVEE